MWQRSDKLDHCRQLVDEYELLMKHSDDQLQKPAGVELGVATVIEWRLTDKQATKRRGTPTVRCSYLSAQPAESEVGPVCGRVLQAASVCGSAVQAAAVLRPGTSVTAA